MKHLLLLSNIVLSIIAVLLTAKLLEQRDKQVSRASKVEPLTEVKADPLEGDYARQEVPEAASKRMERKNLFHVDRFYDDGTGTTAAGAAEETGPKLNEEYELTGTVKIGKGMAAVIIVRQPQSRMSAVRKIIPTRSTSRSRSTPVRPPSKPAPKSAETGKVYRIDDAVGDLGYVLSEITFDAVVLTKEGAEPITLTMDRTDDTSKGRRELAQRAVAEKRKIAEAEAAKQAAAAARAQAAAAAKSKTTTKPGTTTPTRSTPPPPPPPPPPISLPGGPGARTSGAPRTPYVRPNVTTRPSTGK
jgi:hypothetical protein